MKNLIHGILLASILACAASLSAQATPSAPAAPATPSAQAAPATPAAPAAEAALSIDEIVSRHVAAMGGKEAIDKVKSMYMESSFNMMGSDNPSITTVVDGVGFKSEVEFNGTKMVQCFTDKGGWTINPMAGASTATPMPDDVYNIGKGQIYVADPLSDYAAKGNKVELVGREGRAYKVKVTSKEKVESVYLIDPSSFLITSVTSKGKMQDQDVDITTKLSDYRKTDLGYTMPYAMDVDLGGQFQISIAVKKVELNKAIDPAVFEMPK